MDWTQEEQKSLLGKVLEMVGDKFSFASSKSKVQWEKLEVAGRSAKECEEMFNTLTNKIRKFRLFSEIIGEASEDLSKGYSVKFCQDTFPDFPKRPVSAIHLYVSDNPDEFKNVANKDMFRVMSQKWKDLSEDAKEHYKQKYEKKKRRYNKKIGEFRKNHPTVVIRGLTGTSNRQAAPALPNPVAIYTKNAQAKLQAKHPELSAKELHQKCTSKYHKLSEKKRLKWILQAQEQLSDYQAQCELYKQVKPEAKLKPAVLQLSKEDKKILDKHEGKPPAPPKNIFRFFCGKTDLDPSLNIAERSKELSKLYHKLSSSEVEKLQKEYKQVVQAYVDDFTNYYDSLSTEKQELEETNITALKHFEKIVDSSNFKKRKLPPGDEQKPAKRVKSEKSNKLKDKENSSLDEFENNLPKEQELATANTKSLPLTGTTAGSLLKKSSKKLLNGELEDGLLSFSSPVITSTQKKQTETTVKKESPSIATKSSLSVSSLFGIGKKDASASKFQKKAEDSAKLNSEAADEDTFAGFFSPLKSPRTEKDSPSKSKKSKKSKKKD